MTVQRINLSQTYVQDEHQRMQENLARTIETPVPNSAYTEIRLGHVYVKSVTAGQSQQCVETEILVDGSGVNARFYWSTMPFNGKVVAFAIDCSATHPSALSVTLNLQRGTNITVVNTLNVAANGVRAYSVASKPVTFIAGDIFYAVVKFPVAVSSTVFCGFVKMYIQTSS